MTTYETPYGTVDAPSLEAAQKYIASQKAKGVTPAPTPSPGEASQPRKTPARTETTTETSPSLDEVSPGGFAGVVRRGLQLNPMTAPLSRVWESLAGGGGTTVRQPARAAPPSRPQPFANDAGQMVYPPGTSPPKEDQSYTGSVLPLRRDERGGMHPALPESFNPVSIGKSLWQGALQGGRDLAGVGAAPGSAAAPETTATMMQVGNVPNVFERPPASRELVQRGYGLTRPPPEVIRQQQARQGVATAFQQGVEGGAPTALDTMTELNRARAAGQPLALIDVPNQSMQSMASKIYRRGGTAASQIGSFLQKRDQQSMERSERLINMGISDRPLSATAEQLAEQRSAHAEPVWAEVRRGGSTAPLAQQFETAFQESLKAKSEALKAVEQARTLAMQARGRQATAGNVYARSGANATLRAAETGLKEAMDRLDKVSQESLEIQGRLKRAVADKTADAPGAIWSPRLQELLDQREVKDGIRHGWNMERRRAIGKGEAFRPSEYAITGIDAKGNPIVGEVPNMALLMVAKEGLDAILESPKMRDKLTGRLTKDGTSYAALRDGLVQELDRLNPAYKKARNDWAGDTAVIRAGKDGLGLLGSQRFPQIEDAVRHYAKLSDSEREFFKVGVATDLKNRLYKNRTITNEDIKRRLRPLFRSEQEATDFIDALQRERTMRQTGSQIRGLAQMPDESAAASEIALHAAHTVGNVLHGRFLSSAANALRLRRLMSRGATDPALDIEIARTLTDPNLFFRETGRRPQIGDPGPLGGTITHSSTVKLPPPTP